MATLVSENTIERRGFKFRWRYVIGLVLIVPVVAHLLYAAVNSPLTNYYLTVDEALARGATGQTIRVGGDVTFNSIDWDTASGTLTFKLEGDSRNLRVVYRGLAPDALRDQATAIVEGQLNRDGILVATQVLVKCPHRYAPV